MAQNRNRNKNLCVFVFFLLFFFSGIMTRGVRIPEYQSGEPEPVPTSLEKREGEAGVVGQSKSLLRLHYLHVVPTEIHGPWRSAKQKNNARHHKAARGMRARTLSHTQAHAQAHSRRQCCGLVNEDIAPDVFRCTLNMLKMNDWNNIRF